MASLGSRYTKVDKISALKNLISKTEKLFTFSRGMRVLMALSRGLVSTSLGTLDLEVYVTLSLGLILNLCPSLPVNVFCFYHIETLMRDFLFSRPVFLYFLLRC